MSNIENPQQAPEALKRVAWKAVRTLFTLALAELPTLLHLSLTLPKDFDRYHP
jgi:hypothetical protein